MRFRSELSGRVRISRGPKERVTGLAVVLVLVLVLAGCGSSSTTGTTANVAGSSKSIAVAGNGSVSRPQAGREHERARFTVTVPALLAKHLLPTRYTCYGGNESPAIRWGSLPAGTREVVLFVANITPVDGKNQFDWAIAGINPTTHTIAAGRPPAGAVVGRNSFGKTAYTMCVPNGHREENAVVDVFALSHPLAASPGFDAEALWREAARAATAGGVEGWLYTTS